LNRSLIIIGAGGHTKVLIDTLQTYSANILGITDSISNKCNNTLLNIPIIGGDDIVFKFSAEDVYLINGIGKIDGHRRRQEIFDYFQGHGYHFAQVIHSSAIVSSKVELAEGVQIMAGAVVQPGCIIGANTIINTGAMLDHDTLIGSHVHIAPGVTISGGVKIDEGTLIGAGATIIQGMKIGANSIVAAGAVVVRDVADKATVMGVPAKVVKQ
jgi:UDP-perosamine 4-acetyltransferase